MQQVKYIVGAAVLGLIMALGFAPATAVAAPVGIAKIATPGEPLVTQVRHGRRHGRVVVYVRPRRYYKRRVVYVRPVYVKRRHYRRHYYRGGRVTVRHRRAGIYVRF